MELMGVRAGGYRYASPTGFEADFRPGGKWVELAQVVVNFIVTPPVPGSVWSAIFAVQRFYKSRTFSRKAPNPKEFFKALKPKE